MSHLTSIKKGKANIKREKQRRCTSVHVELHLKERDIKEQLRDNLTVRDGLELTRVTVLVACDFT